MEKYFQSQKLPKTVELNAATTINDVLTFIDRTKSTAKDTKELNSTLAFVMTTGEALRKIPPKHLSHRC